MKVISRNQVRAGRTGLTTSLLMNVTKTNEYFNVTTFVYALFCSLRHTKVAACTHNSYAPAINTMNRQCYTVNFHICVIIHLEKKCILLIQLLFLVSTTVTNG